MENSVLPLFNDTKMHWVISMLQIDVNIQEEEEEDLAVL